MKTKYFIPVLLIICAALKAEVSTEQVFTHIYREGVWGKEGFSGGGSMIENARRYVAFLQDFLKKKEVRSVVDLGCGDWGISQYIDWSGIDYIGIDVVEYILERNRIQYARPGIAFLHSDGIDEDLPQADLLISKDVLQHLPNAAISRLLPKLTKFKHCLITNEVHPLTLSSKNLDVAIGETRSLDLTAPPFNLQGEKVLTYPSGGVMKQVLYLSH
jgi:SAM-dependent methyltransferase